MTMNNKIYNMALSLLNSFICNSTIYQIIYSSWLYVVKQELLYYPNLKKKILRIRTIFSSCSYPQNLILFFVNTLKNLIFI